MEKSISKIEIKERRKRSIALYNKLVNTLFDITEVEKKAMERRTGSRNGLRKERNL